MNKVQAAVVGSYYQSLGGGRGVGRRRESATYNRSRRARGLWHRLRPRGPMGGGSSVRRRTQGGRGLRSRVVVPPTPPHRALTLLVARRRAGPQLGRPRLGRPRSAGPQARTVGRGPGRRSGLGPRHALLPVAPSVTRALIGSRSSPPRQRSALISWNKTSAGLRRSVKT